MFIALQTFRPLNSHGTAAAARRIQPAGRGEVAAASVPALALGAYVAGSATAAALVVAASTVAGLGLRLVLG